MLVEQHFADVSTYRKPVNPDWQLAVAEYLEEVGATDLDDPNAPKRKTIRTDADLRALEGARRKAAEVQAQVEHKEALERLKSGTAVLRQKRVRTPAPKKAAKIEVARKVAKPVKKAAKAADVAIKEPSFHQLAKVRRDGFITDLTAGKLVRMVPQCKKTNQFRDYQTQHTDLIFVRRMTELKLIRLTRIITGESFFVLDNFTRHEPIKVTGNLNSDDRELMVRAITSGKLFEVSNVDKQKACSSSAAQLARRHDVDVYTVFNGRKLMGWIVLDDVVIAETEEEKRNAKAAELGGMLQAIDYLRIRKEVAVRMPDSSNDEIEDAAFIEYKRAQRNG